ncbi:MAG: LrgB family protein [Sphingobacteriia bacterium]|nr:LrgB family protein [Sphingobacteriia bacterium]
MNSLFNNEPFVLAFVLGVYLASLYLYRKTKLSFLHPVLISIGVIILILESLNISYTTFKQGSRLIDFMLGPSVVSLGVLLFEHYEHIRKNALAIITAVFVGSFIGIVSVMAIAMALGADSSVIASLQPKSVTTPIAIDLAAKNGGNVSITAIVVVVVGVFGGITGPFILDKLGISSKLARGLALGSAAHGLGTARAMELGAIEGAISGLAIGLMGFATAILIPLINLLFLLF